MHFGDWKKASKSIDVSVVSYSVRHPSSNRLVVLPCEPITNVSSWVPSEEGGGDGNDEGGEGDGVVSGPGKAVVALAAAAAATLWMDFGDMRVVGRWRGAEVGKLRLAEEPLRQRRAASYARAAASGVA